MSAGHRTTAENASSPLLPGGNLINATLNRQLMIWSDRGGASREIGNRWAVRTADALGERVGDSWPVPDAEPFTLLDVIRLDDVPEVSAEANRHQLENPDFLLLGRRHEREPTILQAVDAKFAADRIKISQVSAQVVENLLAIPGGVTRSLVDSHAKDLDGDEVVVVPGVFVVPDSEYTSYLLQRMPRGRGEQIDEQVMKRVPPEPATMFAGLPQSRAIGPLARIDALPVTPRNNIISAIYYFRLACACFYHWSEQEKPLLSDAPPAEPEPGIVVAEIARRAVQAASAFALVSDWAIEVEPFVRAREAVANVASLPVRMRDIRGRIDRAGKAQDNRALRFVRRVIELEFRKRLLELTGEIRSDDPRPLSTILDDVAKAARSLSSEMYDMLDDLVRRAPSANGDDA